MSGLNASFRAECHDTALHPLTWIGLAATAFAAWAFHDTHGAATPNGYLVFEAALHPAARIAGFFLMGIAAVSVAGPRARGTIRYYLCRPVSRSGWVLGKVLALFLLATVFLGVAAGTSWALAQRHGFGDVERIVSGEEDPFHIVEEESDDPVFLGPAMRRHTLLATLSVLPALLTVTTIGVLVSSILSSAAGAVIVAVALVLPLQYLPEVVGMSEAAARLLPVRTATDYLYQLGEFGRHVSTAEWPEYGAGPITGAAVAILGLPWLAAVLFSRLNITE